jgi:hypothetical protein
MIYSKNSNRARVPGGFFHLVEEKTRIKAHGYGHGDLIKLKDEFGFEWRGSAVRNPDNSVTYRFLTSLGKHLSGVANDPLVILRDERGSTWKGFVG